MKYKIARIVKGWQGYQIATHDGNQTLYVKSVRDGKCSFVTDYTHARYYKSLKVAIKHAQSIAVFVRG